MTDAQLDKSFEDACARQWEEETEPYDPLKGVVLEDALKAWSLTHTAKTTDIDHAVDWLVDAARILKDTPYEDRLISISNSLEDLGCEMAKIAEEILAAWRVK